MYKRKVKYGGWIGKKCNIYNSFVKQYFCL